MPRGALRQFIDPTRCFVNGMHSPRLYEDHRKLGFRVETAPTTQPQRMVLVAIVKAQVAAVSQGSSRDRFHAKGKGFARVHVERLAERVRTCSRSRRMAVRIIHECSARPDLREAFTMKQ